MIAKYGIQDEITKLEGIGHPALQQRFVLRKGKPWVPHALPAKFDRCAPKNCFQNSHVLAELAYEENPRMPRYRYVEGYAVKPGIPMIFHHAWCVDKLSRVIDLTWQKPEECSYFGIRFDFETVKEQTDVTRTYSVLAGEIIVNHAYMFREWPGLKAIFEEVKARGPFSGGLLNS